MIRRQALIVTLGILFLQNSVCSQDTLTVLFMYGSKPKREYKDSENKYFGGIHGGHVHIRYRDSVYDFGPYNGFHVFAHKKKLKGEFSSHPDAGFNHNGSQTLLEIQVLISQSQTTILDSVLNQYVSHTPYDYAFIGYRCASNVADILGKIGVICEYGFRRTRRKYFYPKILRTELLLLAEEKNWYWKHSTGRMERKWEKDKPKVRKLIEQKE